MDIRIGNDINMRVHLNKLQQIPPARDIVSVKGELFREPFPKCKCRCACECGVPNILEPTCYTLHGYGCVLYNTLPSNQFVHAPHGHFGGRVRVVCLDIPKPYGKDVLDIYFKSRHQHFDGIYSLVVHITVKEPGYGKNSLHTYTIDFGHVFNLTYDHDGLFGDIVIELPTSVEKTCFIGAGKFDDIVNQDQTCWRHITSLHEEGTLERPIALINTTGGNDGLVVKCLEGYTPNIIMYDNTDALVISDPVYVTTDDGYDYYAIEAIDPLLSIVTITLDNNQWQQE